MSLKVINKSYLEQTLRDFKHDILDNLFVSNNDIDVSNVNDYLEYTFTNVPITMGIDGKYISSLSELITFNSYAVSTPIAIKGGQHIKLTARGYERNVAMISTCDSEGNNITARVMSDGNKVREYDYKAKTDGYICVGYLKSDGDKTTLKIADGNTIDVATTTSEKAISRMNNIGICNLFKKVICIGDSYTEGYISDGHGTATIKKEYSWVALMGKLTGNEWINRGISGANAKTWYTNSTLGYNTLASLGKAQAYIIGLGINDRASGTTRYLEVGTSADIGTDAETYYGYMSKLVVGIAEISPKAAIFINTYPFAAENDVYNTAVKDIVAYYKDTHNVHCIDLAGAYRDLFNDGEFKKDFKASHPTASGHEKIAQMYAYALSDYMDRNKEAFLNVPWIEYDTTTP